MLILQSISAGFLSGLFSCITNLCKWRELHGSGFMHPVSSPVLLFLSKVQEKAREIQLFLKKSSKPSESNVLNLVADGREWRTKWRELHSRSWNTEWKNYIFLLLKRRKLFLLQKAKYLTVYMHLSRGHSSDMVLYLKKLFYQIYFLVQSSRKGEKNRLFLLS